MIRTKVFTAVACLALAAGATHIHASAHDRTLVVAMTNDPNTNEIKVYDADSHALLHMAPSATPRFISAGRSSRVRIVPAS